MFAMALFLSMFGVVMDLDIFSETVRRHIAHLMDAYLVWPYPQKSPASCTPREKGQDKVYAVDPLVARLAHLRNSQRRDIDPTVLTEMQVGMAVHRAARSSVG